MTDSAITGLTLPGMIDEPGCNSGRISSPMPQRGPEPIQRMSLAIFIRLTATVFKHPTGLDQGILRPLRLEMVLRLAELDTGELAEAGDNALGKLGMGVEASPDRRPSQGQLSQR